MTSVDDQQFCLKWNNFQANITSQFETLRDDEDFTDVTIACDGQKIQAHKVVLSACSPFFKELFKTNPCPHPIIFMRDVEAQHITALMEFMYAGEVNIAQTHLSTFLKTAESLKIRGLTDTSSDLNKEDINSQNNLKNKIDKPRLQISSVVNSSQDVHETLSNVSSPPPKRLCKSESEIALKRDSAVNQCEVGEGSKEDCSKDSEKNMLPKIEIPDYLSEKDDEDDDDVREDEEGDGFSGLYPSTDIREFTGGMEIIPQVSAFHEKDGKHELSASGLRFSRRKSVESWLSNNNDQQISFFDESTEFSSVLRKSHEGEQRNRLIKLGEGIEIYEDQLRSVKWSDYRKLTRGLATILFSPAELATCSVTGQRWSRAGNGERPVKPALDRAKVQAIISYVANRFPMVEISRIKQVLAYKCKENSTAFKMKAVRYYGEQMNK